MLPIITILYELFNFNSAISLHTIKSIQVEKND